jgi:hypothetical protein
VDEQTAEFDDWENAIEDIAESIVKKTSAIEVNITKDDVSSGDEESKDEIKSKANLKPTTQADKAKPNEVSAFDQLDD